MKKITQNIGLFLLVLSATFISSCSKDDSGNRDESFNGSEKSIKSFVGEEIYDQLVAFGFNINASLLFLSFLLVNLFRNSQTYHKEY